MNQKPLGTMLAEARAKLGMSIRAMERLSGKGRTYLSLVESGQVSPSIDTLQELCKFYRIEPWEAVAGLTKAELIASLPIPATSPAQVLVQELAKQYGEEMVAALLESAKRVRGAEEFETLIRLFKAVRGGDA